jgi:1,4-dihydroxy-2-naphthoyl-CoA hydrolase
MKKVAGSSIWWNGVRPDIAALNAHGKGSMQDYLGIELLAAGDDWLSARMRVEPRTHQPWGRLHGGASVALAETVGSVAAVCTVDPETSMAVGMEINANHVRPVRDGWVIATARAEARGRTTQVWSIRIETEDGKLVCISRFTAAVIPLAQN